MSSSSKSKSGFYLFASAVETNKPKRKELERLRNRRDTYLLQRHDLLSPFLGENDYFDRKQKRETKKKAAEAEDASHGKKVKAFLLLMNAVSGYRLFR